MQPEVYGPGWILVFILAGVIGGIIGTINKTNSDRDDQ